jgi:hypothetical protein
MGPSRPPPPHCPQVLSRTRSTAIVSGPGGSHSSQIPRVFQLGCSPTATAIHAFIRTFAVLAHAYAPLRHGECTRGLLHNGRQEITCVGTGPHNSSHSHPSTTDLQCTTPCSPCSSRSRPLFKQRGHWLSPWLRTRTSTVPTRYQLRSVALPLHAHSLLVATVWVDHAVTLASRQSPWIRHTEELTEVCVVTR